MPITNQALWENQEKINQDPYGRCCINVARKVMRLLDTDEYKEINTHKIIREADKNVNGRCELTGFMAGCVAELVGWCHSRGQEFRIAWNKSYGVDEDKAKGGIVNPAIYGG